MYVWDGRNCACAGRKTVVWYFPRTANLSILPSWLSREGSVDDWAPDEMAPPSLKRWMNEQACLGVEKRGGPALLCPAAAGVGIVGAERKGSRYDADYGGPRRPSRDKDFPRFIAGQEVKKGWMLRIKQWQRDEGQRSTLRRGNILGEEDPRELQPKAPFQLLLVTRSRERMERLKGKLHVIGPISHHGKNNHPIMRSALPTLRINSKHQHRARRPINPEHGMMCNRPVWSFSLSF